MKWSPRHHPHPRDIPHPGRDLATAIAGTGTAVAELSRQIGVSRTRLNAILAGDAPIRAPIAVALERLGLGMARDWMRRQTAYDAAHLDAVVVSLLATNVSTMMGANHA